MGVERVDIGEMQRIRIERGRNGFCSECGERQGVISWGDALAPTHGFMEMWCEVCALEAQLAHAKERAAVIPELEAKLEAARQATPASAGKESE